MTWETVPLGEIANVVGGSTPKSAVAEYWGGEVPWATPAEISKLPGAYISRTQRTITERGLSASGVRLLPPGSVLLSSRAPIGLVAINTVPMGTNQGFKSLIPGPRIDAKYLYWWLRCHTPMLQSMGRGATFLEISKSVVERIPVPLPPLPEQRRIAAILDEADALRSAARGRLETIPELLTASYDALFGDPVRNPRGWTVQELGNVAAKVSDGPFGSNLKSAHYTDGGVRVIRLQNIGVNEFLDSDAAFISEQHFDSLRRHELVEGDIVVGTLGDPILRACSIPPGVGKAINKADCVQIRPDDEKASGPFLVATLNHPSMVRSAELLAHGQTRSRISMSQVRSLRLAVPPPGRQAEFDDVRQRYGALRDSAESEAIELDALFASLQHRAFRGEL